MSPHDAAVAIAARNLSIAEIEAIITQVIEAATDARECCKYAKAIEARNWGLCCQHEEYWFSMAAELCRREGDHHGAARHFMGAVAAENVRKRRAKDRPI